MISHVIFQMAQFHVLLLTVLAFQRLSVLNFQFAFHICFIAACRMHRPHIVRESFVIHVDKTEVV